MKTKKLKLPDGGTFDLQMPAGFGDSRAFGAPTPMGRTSMYVVGAVGGAVAGFLIVYAATQIAEAIERR
jgi:hypothetical protein